MSKVISNIFFQKDEKRAQIRQPALINWDSRGYWNWQEVHLSLSCRSLAGVSVRTDSYRDPTLPAVTSLARIAGIYIL